MNDFFSLATRDRVAHLQLNRPERLDTMSPPFFPALRDAVRGLGVAGDTRALVISSTGRHFCAGMALDVFGSGDALVATATPRARLAFQESLRRLMDCFTALDEARFPVICAIQGGCVGGALDLATACDIRVCSADAFFTVQEIAIGMAADLGVLQRLPKIVPQGIAREMAYTGERLGAERALAVGLVNAVLPNPAALLDHAMALARSIAAKSPLAIAGSKLALNHARDHSTASALQQMTLLQSAIFDTAEIATAIAAWKAKDTPTSSRSSPSRQSEPARRRSHRACMLVRRREILLPTPVGWLLLLAVFAIAATLLGRALPDLLTVDERLARGPDGRGAKTLVVEGWLDARDLDQALPAIRSGRYQQVLTTGGPIESWNDVSEWKTYADRAAAHLAGRDIGLPINAIAAPPTEQDRTYRSALSVREWARNTGSASTRSICIPRASIRGAHARSTGWRSVRASRSASCPQQSLKSSATGGPSVAVPRRSSVKRSASRGRPAVSGRRHRPRLPTAPHRL